MSVEEMLEYHSHKAYVEDLEAEEAMDRWYSTPIDVRGLAPFRRADD